MKICAVELKASEAIVTLILLKEGLFDLPDCRVRSIKLPKDADSGDLKYFQKTFAQLMSDYSVERVVIKERPTAGKFSGSAAGFKMEAAIQLIEGPIAPVHDGSCPVLVSLLHSPDSPVEHGGQRLLQPDRNLAELLGPRGKALPGLGEHP